VRVQGKKSPREPPSFPGTTPRRSNPTGNLRPSRERAKDRNNARNNGGGNINPEALNAQGIERPPLLVHPVNQSMIRTHNLQRTPPLSTPREINLTGLIQSPDIKTPDRSKIGNKPTDLPTLNLIVTQVPVENKNSPVGSKDIMLHENISPIIVLHYPMNIMDAHARPHLDI
jgi:hypothetical protein